MQKVQSAARRCSGFHIGRSQKNQAPNKQSHLTRPTQELLGSPLKFGQSLWRTKIQNFIYFVALVTARTSPTCRT
jgi:hypothetical protein